MASTRLLLFGSPGAGKTALLEAAEKVSGPFSSELTVLDCDGKAALQMLEAEEPFTVKHPMKKPILDADAVLLVVDVSAPRKQMNEDFRQSARWLKHLYEARGRRTDVADFPVYVVLTKGDRLARKDDTLESWKKTLDEARHQYEDNFRKYLKQHEPGFGTIKLKVLASAIQHPKLVDKPAKADEPFGIAELFDDCRRSANDFQERRNASQSRIQNVIAGLFGLIALLVISVAFLYEFQPPARDSSLDEMLQVLPKPNATAAQRLGGTIKRLEERKVILDKIVDRKDDFAKLPTETQKEVTEYRDDISTYLTLHQKSQTDLKLPYFAKNDAELKKLENAARALAVPDDWAETRLGKRSKEVVDEYNSLREELKREAAWLDAQTEANRKLLIQGNAINGNLLKRVKDAAHQADIWESEFKNRKSPKLPTPREDSVPGVSRFLYEDLIKYEPAKSAHKEWLASLEDLRSESTTMEKRLKALP